MDKTAEKPILGFSAASLFRNESKEDFEAFLHKHFFSVCSNMRLLVTRGTIEFIKEIVNKPLQPGIEFAPGHSVKTETEHETWKAVIEESLTDVGGGMRGMVAITNGVVEGTIAAVHHFTDREDIERSVYTRVLARQTIEHHVPCANDLRTASAMARSWLLHFSEGSPFEKRKIFRPLAVLGEDSKAIALIAHDNKKLELCNFVVHFLDNIVNYYDWVIAIGTTGEWIQKFLISMGHKEYAKKVIRCESGPRGGDVQIADAVCAGRCKDIVFFQDPTTSHPHDSDIRLFEQAIHEKVGKAATATLGRNWETAKIIVESH